LFTLFPTAIANRGKFTSGIVDSGGNLPPMLLTPAKNLLPVSLTPCHRYQQH
jgi:hypothetical protein